jgi:NAD(P)-dependent dehydrogenase (short-subunit alcohol dehydrogenase family)
VSEIETRPIAASGPSLEAKVALVTGAAGGIGAAIVSLFRAAGARVLALDINPDALSHAFGKTDGVVSTRCCDATREDDVQAAVAAAVTMFGRIDVLVNGVACDEPSGTIVELSPAAWDQTFAAYVGCAFMMSRGVVKLMSRAVGVSIMHIA